MLYIQTLPYEIVSKVFIYTWYFIPEIVCPTPSLPAHAKITGSPQVEYGVDDQLTYDCEPGYKLQGDNQLTCQESTEWSPSSPPTCTG